jgi:hypothetical protein
MVDKQWSSFLQSMLGRKSLEIQLMKMGLLGHSEKLEEQLDFDKKFKCCTWLEFVYYYPVLCSYRFA